MKTHSILEAAFGSPARIRILRVLFAAPQPLSGRQVGELARLSHRGAIQALASLVDLGAVRQRRVGKAYQYSLARNNAIVELVIAPGIKAETVLLDDLKKNVIARFGRKAVNLTLFGSLASRTETKGSDIDILAIARDGQAKRSLEVNTETQAPFFRERYQALLSLHCMTVDDLRKKRTLPLIKSVLRNGVRLSGRPLQELLRCRRSPCIEGYSQKEPRGI